MTRKRKALLDIIRASDSPLNAQQVFESVQGVADLATVYRGLHYLEQEGYIASFVFDCEDRGVERYYNLREDHHRHYMHCDSCHRFFPFGGCTVASVFRDIEKASGFAVKEHFLTLKGTCKECQDHE